MSKRIAWFSGQRVLLEHMDFEQAGRIASENLRLQDIWSDGALHGIGQEFNVSIDGLTTTLLNVGQGLGYKSGLRLAITQDSVFDPTAPQRTTDDVPTPQSTGNLAIGLADYSVGMYNYVWIEYLETLDGVLTINPADGSKHYIEADDGYQIVVSTTNPPNYSVGITNGLFLARVTANGPGNPITGLTDLNSREYLQMFHTLDGITELVDARYSQTYGQFPSLVQRLESYEIDGRNPVDTELTAATGQTTSLNARLRMLATRIREILQNTGSWVQTVPITLYHINYNLWPIGTSVTFPQATLPAAWQFVSSYNDVGLRVTSTQSQGGASGGSSGFSNLSNSFSSSGVGDHTHDLSNHTHTMKNHTHEFGNHMHYSSGSTGGVNFSTPAAEFIYSPGDPASRAHTHAVGNLPSGTSYVPAGGPRSDTGSPSDNTSDTPSTNTSGAGGAHSHSTTVTFNPSYLNVIIGQRVT